jgi:hypothetical protein
MFVIVILFHNGIGLDVVAVAACHRGPSGPRYLAFASIRGRT